MAIEFRAECKPTMARFAEWTRDERILATQSQELSWSHFIELLPIKEPIARRAKRRQWA